MKIKSCNPVAKGAYEGVWAVWEIHHNKSFKPNHFIWRNFGTYIDYIRKKALE